jgi:hypothetical protein
MRCQAPGDERVRTGCGCLEACDDRDRAGRGAAGLAPDELPRTISLLVALLPERDGKPYLAAFGATHLDKDHIQGFADLLDRVTIGDLWFTPRVLWEQDQDELCEDAKVFVAEVAGTRDGRGVLGSSSGPRRVPKGLQNRGCRDPPSRAQSVETADRPFRALFGLSARPAGMCM